MYVDNFCNLDEFKIGLLDYIGNNTTKKKDYIGNTLLLLLLLAYNSLFPLIQFL